MAKTKSKSVPEPGPIVPIWGITEFERSRLIVQLRAEIANDSAKAFRAAATNCHGLMDLSQRDQLHAIAEGYERQAKQLQATLNLVKQ